MQLNSLGLCVGYNRNLSDCVGVEGSVEGIIIDNGLDSYLKRNVWKKRLSLCEGDLDD